MADPDKPQGPRRSIHAEVPSTIPVSSRVEPQGRRLLVIAGDRVSSHPLPQSGPFKLGRGEEVDLRVDDPSVSRDHACLYFNRNQIHVSDSGSSNGTRVRGRRLKGNERVPISAGETFEAGSVLLMVQDPFGAEASKAIVSRAGASTDDIVIQDRAMASLYQLAERVARSTINVLLLGETGVGKDVLARKIHAMSPRADKPFLPLNCGALTEQLLESELFGHEKGAFTGAVETKIGLLEAANEGTVFLDEVGELPMSVQVKLLRVLEERAVRRVGGLRSKPFDIRFLAATNRDLNQAIADGDFRSDLFYRLNGISLVIPPLRQRVGEIEGLAHKFIEDASKRAGQDRAPRLSDEALAWLRAHDWPGNIRELQNTIERAVLLCTGELITLEQLPVRMAAVGNTPAAGGTGGFGVVQAGGGEDDDPERRRILDALEHCAGNQTRAAKLLGISRNTLLARLDQYGIARPRKR
ncbi:sigma 54-interacting transcriptional regulator [Paraliomyxa miuraensis]|uniref:sigma 54-interacting transcriptional regulator n=1 Tax=Paraliomyxa miuraensis TaxID=376150 RepID=UPI002252AC57|nr:sigma 54-interacting transcriptional regulator [Paraliomyxa miuraensis]MCX4246788.1 sigma 54-interacting transcriptional regulator [Paraliomyxa miuraensis]